MRPPSKSESTSSRVGLIDSELVVCDEAGVSSFERLCSRQHDHTAFLYAFDLLALDGQDLRREPFETRKATLASLLRLATFYA
jgi:bifunctional non-homologous end joining protein LigD